MGSLPRRGRKRRRGYGNWPDMTGKTGNGWRAAGEKDALKSPISVYEVHLGSWMRVPEEGNRWLTYRELAIRLVRVRT